MKFRVKGGGISLGGGVRMQNADGQVCRLWLKGVIGVV